jgi:HSP20 family protein
MLPEIVHGLGLFDSPFEPLRRELDRVRRVFGEDRGFARESFVPSVEIVETPDAYQIVMELPGLDANDIRIQASGDLLTLSGEKKEEERREHESVHITERRFGAWQRTFRMPSTADMSRVDAQMRSGILTVSVAKRTESKVQDIKVRSV